MLRRRSLLTAAATAAFLPAAPAILRAAESPGVTATSIKIGNTDAYSGNASAYAAVAKADAATFKMLNDKGGINGRTIDFISYDDSYSPPKTVEQTRRLIEQDGVACLFDQLGTPTNTAILKYCNTRKVPHLFLATGADKWGDYKEHPWTIGWQPSYRIEAQIYAKYIGKAKPDAKLGILYQNDDFGKDYTGGMKDVLGAAYDKATVVSYEVTDATIDSQVVTLQGAGVDTLLVAATPKFAAQTIRRVAEMGWKPTIFLTNVSASVGAVIKPAGQENAVGVISSAYAKDPLDPRWKDDAGMNGWRAFMAKYLPDADPSDNNYVFGYGVTLTMAEVLKACGNDLSRENLLRQATSLKDVEIPILLPGIRVNTSPTNYHPIRQMQLMKWTGSSWDLFGEIIEGANT